MQRAFLDALGASPAVLAPAFLGRLAARLRRAEREARAADAAYCRVVARRRASPRDAAAAFADAEAHALIFRAAATDGSSLSLFSFSVCLLLCLHLCLPLPPSLFLSLSL
jgi:hypothetical protein